MILVDLMEKKSDLHVNEMKEFHSNVPLKNSVAMFRSRIPYHIFRYQPYGRRHLGRPFKC